MTAAFELGADKPVSEKVYDVRGDYYVISLAQRNRPTGEEFGKLKIKLTQSLLSLKQASWLRDQIVDLKRQAEQDGDIERAIYSAPPPSAAEPRGRPSTETPGEPVKETGGPGEEDVTEPKMPANTESPEPAAEPEGDTKEQEEQ